jgi:hypothetical protein
MWHCDFVTLSTFHIAQAPFFEPYRRKNHGLGQKYSGVFLKKAPQNYPIARVIFYTLSGQSAYRQMPFPTTIPRIPFIVQRYEKYSRRANFGVPFSATFFISRPVFNLFTHFVANRDVVTLK